MALANVNTSLSVEEDGAEHDFPILCEICLGDSETIRMTRKKFAKVCANFSCSYLEYNGTCLSLLAKARFTAPAHHALITIIASSHHTLPGM